MYATLEGKALEAYDRRWGKIVSFIFGFTIFVYTGTVLLSDFVLEEKVDGETVMTVFFLLIGVYLVITPNKSILKAVGLYSFAVALNKIPVILTFLTYNSSQTIFWITGDAVPQFMFTLGLVLIGLSLNLCYSGYVYLTGRCRGYMMSIIGVSALAILQTYFIFLMVEGGLGFQDYWTDYLTDFTCIMMYLVYLAILLSDGIYRAELNESYRVKANRIRITTMAGYDAALLRSEAERILEGPAAWDSVDGKGPVESEMRFLVSYKDTNAFGTVQKWKDDDRYFFTLSSTYYGYTFIEATRFSAVAAYCDTGDIATCTKITFMDPAGDPVTFGVIDSRREVVA